MKKRFLTALLGLAVILPASGAKLDNARDSVNYAIGVLYGQVKDNLPYGFGQRFDKDLFLEGLQASLEGRDEVFADMDEANIFLMEYFENEGERVAQENQEQALAFLEQNRKNKKVTETESGLQYEVLKKGKGDKRPGPYDYVTTHYEARLLDGTVFESSYEDDEPREFPLQRVIEGMQEGFQLMTPGSKYRFWIPSELGYGESGNYWSDVPGNALLIYDVELLAFEEGYQEEDIYGYGMDLEEYGENSRNMLNLSIGDYNLVKRSESNLGIDPENNDIRYYYDNYVDYNGLIFAQSYEGLVIMDENGEQLFKYSSRHTPRQLSFISPKEGVYPCFILSESHVYNPVIGESEWGETQLFVMEEGNRVRHAGTFEIAPVSLSLEYRNYVPKEANWKVYNENGNVVFYLEEHTFILDPHGSRTLFSGEEAVYTLAPGGTLEAGGTFMESKACRRHLLWKELQKRYNHNIDYIAFGDVNGDGQEDAVFRLEDTNVLFVVLCENYQTVATHSFPIEASEFWLMLYEEHGAFAVKRGILNGRIMLYVPTEDHEDIELRRYEFKDGSLQLIDSTLLDVYAEIG